MVWNQAVDTLNEANKYLRISREARDFVERYMGQIVSILLDQQPLKVGQTERRCVQESLTLAVTIISNDLEIQIERGRRVLSQGLQGGGGIPNLNDVQCKTLDVLACVFCKKKSYYKGTKGNWNVNHLSGLPATRLNLAETFLQEQGFARLVEYMTDRIIINVEDNVKDSVTATENSSSSDSTTTGPELTTINAPACPSRNQQQPSQSSTTPTTTTTQTATTTTTATAAESFPTIDLLHQTLPALLDVYSTAIHNNKNEKHVRALEQAAIDVSKATMRYITSCSEEALKKNIPMEDLKLLIHDLQRIFDKIIKFRRKDTYEFYVFWRKLILKLTTSQSLPLKLFGWQQMETLLEASAAHRPPPRSFVASNAGCTFVNGEYKFIGVVTEDGYGLRSSSGTANANCDISYERTILPDDTQNPDGTTTTSGVAS